MKKILKSRSDENIQPSLCEQLCKEFTMHLVGDVSKFDTVTNHLSYLKRYRAEV